MKLAVYVLLLAGIGGAAAGAPPLVTVPGVLAGLLVASFPKYVALRGRADAVGAGRIWSSTVALSVFNSAATAVACHAVGRLIAWV